MGYMGLENYGASDHASDVYAGVVEKMIDGLASGFRSTRRASEYNTEGCVNVALVIRSGLFKNVDWACTDSDKMIKVLEDSLKDMNRLIKHSTSKYGHLWNDQDNRERHLSQYKRMKGEIERFKTRIEEEV